jgi:hypothetical protein
MLAMNLAVIFEKWDGRGRYETLGIKFEKK